LKTPVAKIIDGIEDGLQYNSNVYAVNVLGRLKELAEGLLDEERRVIQSAYANGYLMTKSAKEYYEDTYDRKQLTLFEDE
jgi:hypothetical protein